MIYSDNLFEEELTDYNLIKRLICENSVPDDKLKTVITRSITENLCLYEDHYLVKKFAKYFIKKKSEGTKEKIKNIIPNIKKKIFKSKYENEALKKELEETKKKLKDTKIKRYGRIAAGVAIGALATKLIDAVRKARAWKKERCAGLVGDDALRCQVKAAQVAIDGLRDLRNKCSERQDPVACEKETSKNIKMWMKRMESVKKKL